MSSTDVPPHPTARRALLALSLLGALAACHGTVDANRDAPVVATPRGSNPFAAAVLTDTSFVGEVRRVLPAGGYTYLEIATADTMRWVAVMGDGPPVGTRARIAAIAIQHDFHSRRLDRDFAELVFGRVVAAAVDAT